MSLWKKCPLVAHWESSCSGVSGGCKNKKATLEGWRVHGDVNRVCLFVVFLLKAWVNRNKVVAKGRRYCFIT